MAVFVWSWAASQVSNEAVSAKRMIGGEVVDEADFDVFESAVAVEADGDGVALLAGVRRLVVVGAAGGRADALSFATDALVRGMFASRIDTLGEAIERRRKVCTVIFKRWRKLSWQTLADLVIK